MLRNAEQIQNIIGVVHIGLIFAAFLALALAALSSGVILVPLGTVTLSHFSWIVGMDVIIKASREQQIDVAAPLYTHLYVWCWYFATRGVVLMVPKIYGVVVRSGRYIFLLLVLHIVSCDD